MSDRASDRAGDEASNRASYRALLKQLYSVNIHGAKKPGLANSRLLSEALGHPERQFLAVHVAGSNGKGSLSTKVAKGLELSGARVGLYTSPHISSFRERIRINGELIPEGVVVDLLSQIFALLAERSIAATFFEITTLLAFCHFAKEGIDIAVVEAGIGGRWDSSNIVIPRLTIITSICLEHTELLGDSIEAIAREKGGIIKPQIPLLIGPNVPFEQIAPIAKEKGAPCIQVDGPFEEFDLENSALARRALELLSVPAAAIEKGVAERPPCRIERITPLNLPAPLCPRAIILDVAHNPSALKRLFISLQRRFPTDRMRVLFALSKNKEIAACLEVLKRYGDSFHLVEGDSGRNLPPERLAVELTAIGVAKERVHLAPTLEENLTLALQEATKRDEQLVVCGSFFIMSAVRAKLGIEEPRD